MNSDDVVKSRFKIRWMIAADIETVCQIESACSSHPWDERTMISVKSSKGVIPYVAVRYNKIVGFMFLELTKEKIEIIHMAIHPDYAGQGIASMLIEKSLQKISENRKSVSCFIRDDCLAAHKLFKKKGFTAVKVVRDYFQDEILEMDHPVHTEYQDGYHFRLGEESSEPKLISAMSEN